MDSDEIRVAQPAPGRASRGLSVLVVVLACVAAASLGYLLRERERASLLSTDNQEMNANLAQMRARLEALTSKVDGLASQRPSEGQASRQPAAPREAAEDRAAVQQARTRRRAQDNRLSKVQAQLEDQGKQIASTREEIEDTRAALKGDLESSHHELSGSIARNHDELVALERRGERAYFEFNLPKSKQFQHVGPISLSLRKTDRKHERYNLEVLVGDNRISKNDLSLYEPALFYPEDSHRPLELVINHIGKDEVQGYVSAPKYKDAEPGSAGAAATAPSTAAANAQSNQAPDSNTLPPTSTGPSLRHRSGSTAP